MISNFREVFCDFRIKVKTQLRVYFYTYSIRKNKSMRIRERGVRISIESGSLSSPYSNESIALN